MANFNTHVTYAAAGSGLLSVLCLQVGLITQKEALLLSLTGTIGGILPDIDLQRSYPSQILFSVLGLIAAFALVFLYENDLSIVELWAVGLGTFLAVRYPVWKLFHYFTRHRGSIHSMLVAMLVTFLTTNLAYYVFHTKPLAAWFYGFFMLFGFIIHLLLDELYSVDFTNRRFKRSFGTALKVVDTREPSIAIALLVCTVACWWVTPDATHFWGTLTSQETYQIIVSRLLPEYVSNLQFLAPN